MSDTTIRNISILGATGTIGCNTLDVIRRHPERFAAFALSANTDVEKLAGQCHEFRPRYAVMADEDSAQRLQDTLKKAGLETEVLAGLEGMEFISSHDEVGAVMAGIVGAAGLMPTLAAARAGKRIMLANKEALVMSGHLFMDEVKQHHAELLPIDSEHNAIFQCMPHDFRRGMEQVGVNRILLTASGGPFRSMELEQLTEVTPDQACAHPNWVMGRKISVDSATMMNKGLEVIEACWLFNTHSDLIQVVIHPQSYIHSMVSYNDGSVLAQLGNPDMRTPIAHAMGWPERIDSGVAPLDIFEVARLDFEAPDLSRYPCLRLAYDAFERGGTATAVLNASNEIAVESFLAGKIRFTDIPHVIEQCLEEADIRPADDLETILQADHEARIITRSGIEAGLGVHR
jgi:1-deoxy-D-xylulose-5-phosphate reductoisomerase